MSWVNVGNYSNLPVNTGVAAWVNGRAVAIFNLSEQGLFAIENYDPASGASVLSRGLICDMQGELCVASPLYKQHYRLSDGVCLEDNKLNIQVFDVKQQDGRVLVRANAQLNQHRG
ncbi:nitrite reductase small subunit NirD [Shewanella sp. CG12_big_fil_rev_8_21_14_0_65_47_15]|uniref:nitrite reductase small subunit NirD n=1 Tax=Shewanella sp. CG12_big_fil_rev_8_21_14_0_65_47_15 TaxID=1975537 RepID=UPI000CAA5635|nr:nitrite reductase small subunit NirD [Shewanella sp. CG12_big_fil_rev_8_21_14_0_65_47_15]PIW60449.1 MAG: nitrite reductase (NAD(P)H) small subunit [Shewanella sp. CG12_big_fil_rev_8_21_14_0_65_47_15]